MKKMTIIIPFHIVSVTYLVLLSSYTHSMAMVLECTYFTAKSLNVHIQWRLAVECVDSMAKPLNAQIQ